MVAGRARREASEATYRHRLRVSATEASAVSHGETETALGCRSRVYRHDLGKGGHLRCRGSPVYSWTITVK